LRRIGETNCLPAKLQCTPGVRERQLCQAPGLPRPYSGEVYRATDTKLKRDVAIKILPEEVSRDKERLARFEREAHVLASLNHPNIASIYGLEESDGVPCLVLELVEGQTLAEGLDEGALPVDKALDLGRQITSALEAAHEKGIIHRDLKPANIKVTPEGSANVLDFGLAKAFADESAEISGDASQSPTMTVAAHALADKVLHGVSGVHHPASQPVAAIAQMPMVPNMNSTAVPA
jgi:serine/threonine-protein kinase